MRRMCELHAEADAMIATLLASLSCAVCSGPSTVSRALSGRRAPRCLASVPPTWI